MIKNIEWESNEGIHGIIYNAKRTKKKIILRLSFKYIPYSYGATGYAILEILTKRGYKTLKSIHFMDCGREIPEAKDHEIRLKAYAEYLYNKVTTPSVGESD